MILKNLTNYIKNVALILGPTYMGSNATYKHIVPVYPLKKVDGTDITSFNTYWTTSEGNMLPFMNTQTYLTFKESSVNSTYTYAIFGSGTTPVTEDDYTLESIIASGLSMYPTTSPQYNVTNMIIDSQNNKVVRNVPVHIAVKNTSSADITISEMGLYQVVRNNGSSSNPIPLMLHREVFDPVVLAPGEVRSFQIDFEFVNQLV